MATQASESSVSAILKEVYPGAIEDELNNEIALWAVMDKEKVTIDGQGQHIVRPFRVNRNQGRFDAFPIQITDCGVDCPNIAFPVPQFL